VRVRTNNIDVELMQGTVELRHAGPVHSTLAGDPKDAVFIAVEGDRFAMSFRKGTFLL